MSRAEIDCKRFCLLRCFIAVFLSVAVQFILLGVFLLFVNFKILHPIVWVTETLSIIFRIYTWLYLMPLISVVILYGVFVGNSRFAPKKYYPTRFSYFRGTIIKKLIAVCLHSLIGFLTGWLYSRFLEDRYKVLLIECFDNYCLNSRYIFLTFSGVYASIYFFFKEEINRECELEFPVIQEKKFVRIRSQLYSTLYTSLIKAVMPTISFVMMYWAFGWIIRNKISYLLGVDPDDNLASLWNILINIKLILYAWILSSQILSNFYLIDMFFNVLLTRQKTFIIEKNPLCGEVGDVTIVEALSLSQLPVVQQLACLDLFNLTNLKKSPRRLQIFSLSVPGGHPYNWNQLSGQCLSIINEFTEELTTSLKEISTLKNRNIYSTIKKPAAMEAERLLMRRHNETVGIRNLTVEHFSPERPHPQPGPFMALLQEFKLACDETYKNMFNAIPGLYYFFGEQKESKALFLLSKSQNIIWLAQALAGICAVSITEDQYGVVQNQLPAIIKALLKLKIELDKISTINLSGKKIDKSSIALRSAVKRSLYRICTVFSDYIKDIIDDPETQRILICFANYQDV